MHVYQTLLIQNRIRRILILTLCLCFNANAAVVLTTGNDEQSFLPYWQIEGKGLSLRLVQRIPDQIRAFYMARNFSSVHAEKIALSCAFQTVFKNTSNATEPSPLKYDLRQWKVIRDGKESGLKTREDWNKDWLATNIEKVVRLSFEWGLIPTSMQYEPNDYNWGISFFDLRPGTNFDLKVSWQQYGKRYQFIIKDMQCSPDIHPDPEDFRNKAND